MLNLAPKRHTAGFCTGAKRTTVLEQRIHRVVVAVDDRVFWPSSRVSK